jgi:hypothetical protein
MYVKWNGTCSAPFSVSNGVKQGGILSPILFCIYMDDLLCELEKNGIGCHVGNMYSGTFMYADDIILLCPSVSGMQNMLITCHKYASDFDIIFNAGKCKLIMFSDKRRKDTIKPVLNLGSDILEIVDKIDHLGHVIPSDISDTYDVQMQQAKFNRKANAVLADFNGISGIVTYQVMKTYCSAFYGSQLWDLNHQNIEGLCVSWRKACRRALRFPWRTHTNLLPSLCNSMSLKYLLMNRTLKFYHSCFTSDNSHIRFSIRNALQVSNTTVGKNLRYLMYILNMSTECIINHSRSKLHRLMYNKFYNISCLDKCHSGIIRECIEVQDGVRFCCITKEDCNMLIEHLTTV